MVVQPLASGLVAKGFAIEQFGFEVPGRQGYGTEGAYTKNGVADVFTYQYLQRFTSIFRRVCCRTKCLRESISVTSAATAKINAKKARYRGHFFVVQGVRQKNLGHKHGEQNIRQMISQMVLFRGESGLNQGPAESSNAKTAQTAAPEIDVYLQPVPARGKRSRRLKYSAGWHGANGL